jgi:hypothetical protein
LFKISDRLPGFRRDHDIQMDASMDRDACSWGLLGKTGRNTKQGRPENNQHALIAEHKLTSIHDANCEVIAQFARNRHLEQL